MLPDSTPQQLPQDLSPKDRLHLFGGLSRVMLKTVGTYGLLDEGDSVLVGLSGGKDSYTLFELLWEARKKAPVRFDIVGVHLDQGQPGYDGSAMKGWLDRFGAPYEIVREDTYSIVKQKMNEAGANTGSTLCAPCSRLRRGILYTTAARLGCNKIALGHHRDDALETLLLNLLYGGKLQAMPATYTTNDERFEVIRPLIECAERDIARYAAAARFPIIPCNLCGSQSGLKRVRVARLLDALEKETPDVRATMLGALKNVRPTHLLDREVAQSWSASAGRYKPRR